MSTRYLDPKNDLAFKKVFGAEKHKRIPIDFLNAVFRLKDEDKIVNLDFLNSVQPPEIEARKESIVDVLVQDQRGTKYIVEMQVAKMGGFEKRAQYYAAKAYCAHFGPGKKYEDLKKVIFLAVTDYIVFPRKTDYKSDHVILDNKTYEQDLKDFSFTFIELPKFTKPLEQLTTIEDRWYYFLKHADGSRNIAEILAHHPEIKEAYEILDRYSWTENELQWYDKLIMNIADAQGVLDAATDDARKAGLQAGRQEGLQAGLQEGLQEGLQVGRREGYQAARIEIAKQMISKGFSVDQIELPMQLSQEEVVMLQSELSSASTKM